MKKTITFYSAEQTNAIRAAIVNNVINSKELKKVAKDLNKSYACIYQKAISERGKMLKQSKKEVVQENNVSINLKEIKIPIKGWRFDGSHIIITY